MAHMTLPPGPRGTPLVGNTFEYVRDELGYLHRCAREFGDVVRLRLGGTIVYVLNHPALIEQVLRGRPEDFRKDVLTRGLIPVVGQGLLTSEGDFWRRQRRLAQPAFQHQQIRRYGEVMVEAAGRMLAGWADGRVADVHRDFMGLTLDVVARTLFGADVAAEAHDVGEALETIMEYFQSPLRWLPARERLPLPGSRKFRRAVARVDEILYEIIARRRSESGSGEPGDLLGRLLAAQDAEGGGGMTDRQLRDEAVTLFLAGHETTALVLTYAFYLLARNPEAEARLAAEWDAVLGGRAPTADDVPRLTYTDWVVKETMRLLPPAWGIGREALVDTEIGGYAVPAGTQVFLVQWLVHRDPRWYPDPEAFRPDRWADDLIKRLPRCTYFPFGDGPRVCIGNHFALMEAILLLATIGRRFRLSLDPGYTLRLAPSITLRPKGGMPMTIQDRRSTPRPA